MPKGRPRMDPGGHGDDPVILSVAEALWKVHEGYTVEDLPGPVDWRPDNAEDRADKAMFMGHALVVLDHLITAGWKPAGATDA